MLSLVLILHYYQLRTETRTYERNYDHVAQHTRILCLPTASELCPGFDVTRLPHATPSHAHTRQTVCRTGVRSSLVHGARVHANTQGRSWVWRERDLGRPRKQGRHLACDTSPCAHAPGRERCLPTNLRSSSVTTSLAVGRQSPTAKDHPPKTVVVLSRVTKNNNRKFKLLNTSSSTVLLSLFTPRELHGNGNGLWQEWRGGA